MELYVSLAACIIALISVIYSHKVEKRTAKLVERMNLLEKQANEFGNNAKDLSPLEYLAAKEKKDEFY